MGKNIHQEMPFPTAKWDLVLCDSAPQRDGEGKVLWEALVSTQHKAGGDASAAQGTENSIGGRQPTSRQGDEVCPCQARGISDLRSDLHGATRCAGGCWLSTAHSHSPQQELMGTGLGPGPAPTLSRGGPQQRLEPCPWVTHGAEAPTRPKSPHNSFHYSAEQPRNSPLLMRGRPPKGGREEAGKILNSSPSNTRGSLRGLLPAHSRSEPGTRSTQGCSGNSAVGTSIQAPCAPPWGA